MSQIDFHRRKFLTLGCAAIGAAVLPSSLLATLSTPLPRTLTIHNIHTGENLTTEFFDGKRYNRQELTRLNHLFRDFRQERVKRIDPELFDQLFLLQVMVGSRKPIQLVSGYRSPLTNNKLRSRSKGVAKNSYHTKGQAMDLYIEGIQLSQLRKAALHMKAGGVGYYPSSNFIHIDTGPVRSWS